MFDIYILYLIIGIVGGFLGGLLGLGGGIIFVPSLFFIFHYNELYLDNIMQSAVSTSLACVVISSLSAAVKHNKNKLINWKLFYRMLPGLSLGSMVGVILITILSSNIIKIYYGILLIVIAIYMITTTESYKNEVTIKENNKYKFLNTFAFFTGSVSTLLGIGGGTLTTPYFKFFGETLKRSIATAAACGVPIALFGIIITYVVSMTTQILENNIFNFIDYNAFLLISISTLIFSYIGAGITYISDSISLKKIFCFSLIIIGITILIS